MTLAALYQHPTAPTTETSSVRECPVCRRMIAVSATFFTHKDKARQRCPMSGQPAPTKWRNRMPDYGRRP